VQTETQLTSRLVKSWNQMGLEVISIHGGGSLQAPGWPDVFVCSRQWSGFIEFKGPRTTTQAHQRRIISALENSSTNVCLVRFIKVSNDTWHLRFEKTNKEIIGDISLTGFDGEVAAKLLKILASL
jgi:hypothetical protein